jgi:hypothetical protein
MNLLEELIFMRDFVILFLNHLLQSRILLIVIKQKRERERRKKEDFFFALTHFFDHLFK